MKRYSYAIHCLKADLDACYASTSTEQYFVACNEKRIEDLQKALKKLGYDDTASPLDVGDAGSGGGGGPGSEGGGS